MQRHSESLLSDVIREEDKFDFVLWSAQTRCYFSALLLLDILALLSSSRIHDSDAGNGVSTLLAQVMYGNFLSILL